MLELEPQVREGVVALLGETGGRLHETLAQVILSLRDRPIEPVQLLRRELLVAVVIADKVAQHTRRLDPAPRNLRLALFVCSDRVKLGLDMLYLAFPRMPLLLDNTKQLR